MVLYKNNLCCGLINVDLDFYIVVELDVGSRVNGCLSTKWLVTKSTFKRPEYYAIF